jgi:hypothetical protein
MEKFAKKRKKKVELGPNSKHRASPKLGSILVCYNQTSLSAKRSLVVAKKQLNFNSTPSFFLKILKFNSAPKVDLS